MRKKVMVLAGVLIVMSFLVGCASTYPVGVLFTEVKLPAEATSTNTGSRVGTSECVSILSLVATGDASIQAAMKNGGITKIHHVDWDARNILGIYGQYKTTVYGE